VKCGGVLADASAAGRELWPGGSGITNAYAVISPFSSSIVGGRVVTRPIADRTTVTD